MPWFVILPLRSLALCTCCREGPRKRQGIKTRKRQQETSKTVSFGSQLPRICLIRAVTTSSTSFLCSEHMRCASFAPWPLRRQSRSECFLFGVGFSELCDPPGRKRAKRCRAKRSELTYPVSYMRPCGPDPECFCLGSAIYLG